MGKLKCVFIGNCQNNALIHFLNKSNEFNEKYYTVNYTNYQLYKKNNGKDFYTLQRITQ